MSVPNGSTTLYWFPGTCARVTLIALEEIGLPFELTTVPDRRDPAYRAVNPKGKVPALVVDGRTITENPAIQTYLARRFPDASLLPTDPERELDALSTMCWFASNVHTLIPRLRYPAQFSEPPESHESVRALARRQLEDAFELLEARLEGREWLFDEWTIVDGYMLWLWFRATGSGMDGSRFPRCADHARRCEVRPSVARVLEREEAELARLIASGELTRRLPPYPVGRAPTSRT